MTGLGNHEIPGWVDTTPRSQLWPKDVFGWSEKIFRFSIQLRTLWRIAKRALQTHVKDELRFIEQDSSAIYMSDRRAAPN